MLMEEMSLTISLRFSLYLQGCRFFALVLRVNGLGLMVWGLWLFFPGLGFGSWGVVLHHLHVDGGDLHADFPPLSTVPKGAKG